MPLLLAPAAAQRVLTPSTKHGGARITSGLFTLRTRAHDDFIDMGKCRKGNATDAEELETANLQESTLSVSGRHRMFDIVHHDIADKVRIENLFAESVLLE